MQQFQTRSRCGIQMRAVVAVRCGNFKRAAAAAFKCGQWRQRGAAVSNAQLLQHSNAGSRGGGVQQFQTRSCYGIQMRAVAAAGLRTTKCTPQLRDHISHKLRATPPMQSTNNEPKSRTARTIYMKRHLTKSLSYLLLATIGFTVTVLAAHIPGPVDVLRGSVCTIDSP